MNIYEHNDTNKGIDNHKTYINGLRYSWSSIINAKLTYINQILFNICIWMFLNVATCDACANHWQKLCDDSLLHGSKNDVETSHIWVGVEKYIGLKARNFCSHAISVSSIYSCVQKEGTRIKKAKRVGDETFAKFQEAREQLLSIHGSSHFRICECCSAKVLSYAI